MTDPPPGLSRSVEDYLKVIYGLSERGATASTSAIAEALDVQPASVTGMVKRLAEADLLEHVPYRGVRLTEEGAREALGVLRRHRIIETYLCRRLGYTWDDVHHEAEMLEHAASDQLIERMAAALGSPRHDPHGAPIPTAGGAIEVRASGTLAEADAGGTFLIQAVLDEKSALLRSMADLGLTVGAHVEVQSHDPRDGAVTFRVAGTGGRGRVADLALAERVFVAPDEP